MPTALIILAAGQGTRMNSDLPKVLHPLGGAPLVLHAMESGAAVSPDRTVIIAGHGAEAVTKAAQDLDPDVQVVRQSEQLGTGHAVLQAREALTGFSGNVVVLYGDTPFVRPETIENMVAALGSNDIAVLGFQAADPGRYGRLVMDGNRLERIVEFKDATVSERAITLCNSGVVAADAQQMFALLDQVGNDNASGEYYLPDIVGLARTAGQSVTAVICDESETQGINTRTELAAAEATFQARARAAALDNGVTLLTPETVYFAYDTVIGRDALIEQNVVFGPGVTIESGAHIRAFSHLEGCHVARGAIIGPYARLRPGAEIYEDARVGNFVEIKNAVICEGAKANHLTYIGDAHVGARSNIGAGTVTCNYDGFMKHHTEIGEGAFIGSDTMLVAPVKIGKGAMTGSGSVITRDVPDDAMGIGRPRQETKPGFAARLRDQLRAAKARKGSR